MPHDPMNPDGGQPRALSNGTTVEEIMSVVEGTAQVADQLKSASALVAQILGKNDALQIDWQNLPAELLDGNGNIEGTPWSGEDVSNALGALAQFQNYWDGEPVVQGNYGAVLEKMSRALTVIPTFIQSRPQ